MRVAFLHGGIPSLGHSGSTIAAWTIIEELLSAGHEVTAVLLPEHTLIDETASDRLAALEGLGVAVEVVEVPAAPEVAGPRWRRRLAFARSLALPRDAELFPPVRAAGRVSEALGRALAGCAAAREWDARQAALWWQGVEQGARTSLAT